MKDHRDLHILVKLGGTYEAETWDAIQAALRRHRWHTSITPKQGYRHTIHRLALGGQKDENQPGMLVVYDETFETLRIQVSDPAIPSGDVKGIQRLCAQLRLRLRGLLGIELPDIWTVGIAEAVVWEAVTTLRSGVSARGQRRFLVTYDIPRMIRAMDQNGDVITWRSTRRRVHIEAVDKRDDALKVSVRLTAGVLARFAGHKGATLAEVLGDPRLRRVSLEHEMERTGLRDVKAVVMRTLGARLEAAGVKASDADELIGFLWQVVHVGKEVAKRKYDERTWKRRVADLKAVGIAPVVTEVELSELVLAIADEGSLPTQGQMANVMWVLGATRKDAPHMGSKEPTLERAMSRWQQIVEGAARLSQQIADTHPDLFPKEGPRPDQDVLAAVLRGDAETFDAAYDRTHGDDLRDLGWTPDGTTTDTTSMPALAA